MVTDLTNSRPGIVAIDLHRGHLDPAGATMPLEAGTLITETTKRQ